MKKYWLEFLIGTAILVLFIFGWKTKFNVENNRESRLKKIENRIEKLEGVKK